MIDFLLGVIVGAFGCLIVVGIAASNAVKHAKCDEDADWWKNGGECPYGNVEE